MTISGISRVQSSEAVAAVERFGTGGKIGISSAVPVSAALSSLVIPYGATGTGYSTTLALANVAPRAVDTTVSFAGVSRTLHFNPNAVVRFALADFLNIQTTQLVTGAIRVDTSSIFGPISTIVGVADIDNATSVVSLEARPATTESRFLQVVQGNGWFTGLCIATGSTAANVTVDVFDVTGGSVKSASITIGANQQIAKLVSELVPAVNVQMGGTIRIRSDQPVWTWQIYGNGQIMASGPPE